jgi:hypothetical protein
MTALRTESIRGVIKPSQNIRAKTPAYPQKKMVPQNRRLLDHDRSACPTISVAKYGISAINITKNEVTIHTSIEANLIVNPVCMLVSRSATDRKQTKLRPSNRTVKPLCSANDAERNETLFARSETSNGG